MTQQTFAQFIGISPASLSSIFNDRTKPTITIIEAIKNKIPKISVNWLMFGTEPMFEDGQIMPVKLQEQLNSSASDLMIDFDSAISKPTSTSVNSEKDVHEVVSHKMENTVVKYIDKPQRMISEIRVFYDDQTWETFVPKK